MILGMRRATRSLLLVLLFAASRAPAADRTYGSRNVARSKGTVTKARSVGGHARAVSSKCTACERDLKGPIARNPAARREFQRERRCPATGRMTGACPGYVADNIVPLKRGADEPSNMQWQTVADAKAKDRIE
jgi:hypothetical protein